MNGSHRRIESIVHEDSMGSRSIQWNTTNFIKKIIAPYVTALSYLRYDVILSSLKVVIWKIDLVFYLSPKEESTNVVVKPTIVYVILFPNVIH